MSYPTSYNLGLTGWPLGHSFSPSIHNSFLRELGLKGAYILLPVPPLPEGAQALGEIVAQIRRKDLHGLNVTIPYKQTIITLLDTLTERAKTIGAVNTIFLQGDHLIGDNTDAPGFTVDLERFLATIPTSEKHRSQSALVLGAGGSARAVVYGLIQSGWRVFIASRRIEQAQSLAADLEKVGLEVKGDLNVYPPEVKALPLTPADLSKIPPGLIVNTTPVGMSPNVDASPWPEEISLPPQSIVYDLVYNPPKTLLVRRALENGLHAKAGLGMLIEQAALSFQLWTAAAVPSAIKNTILHSLSYPSIGE